MLELEERKYRELVQGLETEALLIVADEIENILYERLRNERLDWAEESVQTDSRAGRKSKLTKILSVRGKEGQRQEDADEEAVQDCEYAGDDIT